MNSAVILTFLWLLILCLSEEYHSKVVTQYGVFNGHVIKSRGGRDIFAFEGIPYAQPPLGKLRFKDPVKLERSNSVFEAKNGFKDCMQIGQLPTAASDMKGAQNSTKYVGSEDCLYLNIYTPQLEPKQLLPVLFLIHGGGFMACSSSEAWMGPRYFLDENRDLVIVNVNYRLNIFGFLSANDDNLPGNLGLKDQTMALKWVKENINAFGGDPNSVTIGGMSSGGACVNHHLNSKLSKGLFHNAISHSGTADCPWGKQSVEDARRMASNIINFLGCPFEPKDLLDCLQEASAETLLDSLEALKVNKTNLVTYLVPVNEVDSPHAFMTEQSIEKGSSVPWLSGVTSEEGLAFYQFLGLGNPRYLDLSAFKQNYKELLPIVAYYDSRTGNERITEELKEFYFGDKEFSEDTAKNFIQLLSDRLINHGTLLSARSHKGKHYMYLFSYKGKNSLSILRPKGTEGGVSHGDDVFYFHNNQFATVELQDNDLELSNALLDMWYNFIREGDPTPETHLWLESEGGKRYLNISNEGLVMASDMFRDRMNFHDNLERVTYRKDEL